MDLKENQDIIIWDFCLAEEFKNRQAGCAFVIDVYDREPQLSYYIVKNRLSKTAACPQQPPREMLLKALEEKAAGQIRDTLYDINDDLRGWIKDNLLK